MEARGFVVLNWVDAGWLRFFARSAVARPDHLRKLVLFQWLGDQASMAIWRAAKFKTRAGTASELASGLRVGLYQACATSPQLASFNRTYEAARYMTDMDWALLLGAMVVTTDAWNRIPEDVRPALVRAAQAAGARLREETRKDGEVSIAAIAGRRDGGARRRRGEGRMVQRGYGGLPEDQGSSRAA